jgi:hypothetical protein
MLLLLLQRRALSALDSLQNSGSDLLCHRDAVLLPWLIRTAHALFANATLECMSERLADALCVYQRHCKG